MSEAPRRPLIRRQPWELERWREQLRAGSVSAEVATASGSLRLAAEQLLRRAADGRQLQSVRILGEHGAPALSGISVVAEDGTALAVEVEPGPAGSMRVLVPAVEQPTRVRVRLGDSGPDAEVLLPVVRPWVIHLIHHSHLDIGYTDPQAIVLEQQGSYLDTALDLMAATDGWPDDARFRWAAEALWPFQRWAATRPPRRVELLMERVRQRRLELSAMPFNLHTEACSTAELHELLRGARAVAERWDVPLVAAMQTDVPGAVSGLPDALSDAGVRYLAVAHNWAGRSVPYLVGGEAVPRLFRWRGATGRDVLVWMTDTPHGLAYAEGALLGLADSLGTVEDLLPAYLDAIAAGRYPYGRELLGWAVSDPAPDRAPHPHDTLHLRVISRFADNTAPSQVPARIVRAWNERWSSPRLRLSTNADFFEAVEAAEGEAAGAIPTLTGDWNDWWSDGIGAGAQEMAIQRRTQAMLPEAATVASLGRALGAPPAPDLAGDSAAAYESLALFDEHTWGASNPWGTRDEGDASGLLQWQWKVARTLAAHDRASALLATGLTHLGDRVPPAPAALASFVVLNTCAWERTDLVRAFLPEASVPADVLVDVIDARTGRSLPFDEEPQANLDHRDAGRLLRILVHDVPPVSVVRLDVHAREERGETSGGVLPDGVTIPVPHRLSNGHLSFELDLARARIGSIVEGQTGRELVADETAFGFGGYVHDRYAATGGFNHASSRLEATERLALLGSRSTGSHAVVIEAVSGATLQRVTYDHWVDGVGSVRTTVTLPHHAPCADVEVRVSKEATSAKESGYVTFPFRMRDPVVRIDVAGGIVGTGIPAIPGGAAHMRAMREWISLEEDDLAIAWATVDAPLVHIGGLPLPFAPFPPTVDAEPATVASWIHNNVWDTNFPSAQSFDRPFRYRISAGPIGRVGEGMILAHRSATSATRPLLAVLARGEGAEPLASRSILELGDRSIELIDITPVGEDQLLVHVRSLSDEAVTSSVRSSLPVAAAHTSTWLGRTGAELNVRDGTIVVALAPRAVGSFVLMLGESA